MKRSSSALTFVVACVVFSSAIGWPVALAHGGPLSGAVLNRSPQAAPGSATAAAAGAPLSESDVLGFLRSRLGPGDPFMNPTRDQVLAALRAEVLRRGVSFRYATLGAFSNELGKFGALSNVTFALRDNFGPPATLDALSGRWLIAKVGATTTFARGGNTYQRQESGANAGSLVINIGGDYVWDSPSGILRGRWRKATAEEMARSDKGGDGLVVLGAKSSADWLVVRRNEEGPEGQGIMITDLATRNLRERATR